MMLTDAQKALAIRDYASARNQYESLAGLGSREALLALGFIYEIGGHGVTRNYTLARYWFERSLAEGKSVRAALELGKFYYFGLGVQVDLEKSFSYLSMLEKSNDATALLRLAAMFELGEGAPKDTYRARELYRRSARLKNICARKHLGLLETKQGNIFIGLTLCASAFVHGAALRLINQHDDRLRTW